MTYLPIAVIPFTILHDLGITRDDNLFKGYCYNKHGNDDMLVARFTLDQLHDMHHKLQEVLNGDGTDWSCQPCLGEALNDYGTRLRWAIDKKG